MNKLKQSFLHFYNTFNFKDLHKYPKQTLKKLHLQLLCEYYFYHKNKYYARSSIANYVIENLPKVNDAEFNNYYCLSLKSFKLAKRGNEIKQLTDNSQFLNKATLIDKALVHDFVLNVDKFFHENNTFTEKVNNLQKLIDDMEKVL